MTYHKRNEKSTELITEDIGTECGSKTKKQGTGHGGVFPLTTDMNSQHESSSIHYLVLFVGYNTALQMQHYSVDFSRWVYEEETNMS